MVRKIAFISVTALICLAIQTLGADDAVIRGRVTDNTGKPIRGVIVKASAGDKAISRYTQIDGSYEIRVPAGRYEVSADAFGFASNKQSKDTSQPGDTNLSLPPRIDVTRLTGA